MKRECEIISSPVSPSPPRFDWTAYPAKTVELDAYRELAGLLYEGSVDLIVHDEA